MSFRNVYQDARRAEAYATLDYGDTYHLAFRDLPDLLQKHARGCRALDFGCGAGRSTRFLQHLGYDTWGSTSRQRCSQSPGRCSPTAGSSSSASAT